MHKNIHSTAVGGTRFNERCYRRHVSSATFLYYFLHEKTCLNVHTEFKFLHKYLIIIIITVIIIVR